MKNYRAVIRDTLKSVQSDIPYDIKMAFPESKPAGNLITFYEITNTAVSYTHLRGLASKGIEVYPNYTGPTAKCLNYATQIGDLTKGEREELDATCYDDDVEHSITGIRKKADAFEVTFLYNAKDATSDYRVLAALEDAGVSVPIMVKLPDGTKFNNSGVPSLKIKGPGVNSLMEATVSYKLDGDWSREFPAA